MSDLVEKAIKFAYKLHEGQVRRDGSPYIEHPVLVASYVEKFYKNHYAYSEDVKIAAYLHDLLEDQGNKVSYEEISELFGSKVALYVGWLTRKPGEKKTDYYSELSKAPAQAIWIKFCDRLANLTDSSKLILNYENHNFISYYVQDTIKMLDILIPEYEDRTVVSEIIKSISCNLEKLYIKEIIYD